MSSCKSQRLEVKFEDAFNTAEVEVESDGIFRAVRSSRIAFEAEIEC